LALANFGQSSEQPHPLYKFQRQAILPVLDLAVSWSRKIAMTQETVLLPDALALRARNAGLLSDAAIRQILEAAMRREAGRELMRLADDIREARIAPMSDEENVAEVKAHRAERRACQS